MMITYENTKPLYEKSGIKPGFGSFFAGDDKVACPLSMHRIAETEIAKQCGFGYFKNLTNDAGEVTFSPMSFAWGFDGRPKAECANNNTFHAPSFEQGREVRAAFEKDGEVIDLREAWAVKAV